MTAGLPKLLIQAFGGFMPKGFLFFYPSHLFTEQKPIYFKCVLEKEKILKDHEIAKTKAQLASKSRGVGF